VQRCLAHLHHSTRRAQHAITAHAPAAFRQSSTPRLNDFTHDFARAPCSRAVHSAAGGHIAAPQRRPGDRGTPLEAAETSRSADPTHPHYFSKNNARHGHGSVTQRAGKWHTNTHTPRPQRRG
jgi:hypothetical protein